MVRDARILGPVKQLLVDQVYVYQFKINAKPAFGGESWVWHQDYIAWKICDNLPAPTAPSASSDSFALAFVQTGLAAVGNVSLLRAAIEMYEKDNEEPVDPALPAQAEFWLGEAFRGSFRAEALDPGAMDEKALGDALERKAQFLLSAQGHYLRCIRRGDGEWATAAGFRIGEMYEDLYEQLVNAPLPRGLDEQQSVLYRQQLRDKVKNLVGKAIRVYEQTLSTAQRVGAQNPYVKKTEDALERLRKLLL